MHSVYSIHSTVISQVFTPLRDTRRQRKEEEKMGEIESYMQMQTKASSGCDPAWQGVMNWWWALLKLEYNTHTHWEWREDESERELLEGFIIASSESCFLGQF